MLIFQMQLLFDEKKITLISFFEYRMLYKLISILLKLDEDKNNTLDR